ncbi:MAG: SPFH domain-containing protein [Pirellulales bacterium]
MPQLNRPKWLESARWALGGGALLVALAVAAVLGGIAYYWTSCFEVPSQHLAVLTRKTGRALPNDQEFAPTDEYQGVQLQVLGEGRYFRNPWHWSWEVVPQIEIPQGKMGVRIRLHGDDLPHGEILARQPNQKGIVAEVLRPGRYAINAKLIDSQGQPLFPRLRENYAELIELHSPVSIPAGYKGVVTSMAAPLPADPNQLLVPEGFRGVQSKTLDEGTYLLNPYEYRVDLIDCRSQRFNLSSGGDMGFPSKDGFWITLDGAIEFRIIPDKAAEVFVNFNDSENDDGSDTKIDEELIRKVILPNARSFCRLKGSEFSGREFISGEKRNEFQDEFRKSMETTCRLHNVSIVQVAITSISPPEQIADPVRQRQIAIQNEKRFQREVLQQESEKELAIQKAMITQGQELVDTERQVVQITTEAKRQQEVALIESQQRLKVAELQLEAAQDLAAAELARGKAEADVIHFQNAATAAGWEKAVKAFEGQGAEYARWVMLRKLAPAFRQMMVNTADSPIMDVFKQYAAPTQAPSGVIPALPTAARNEAITEVQAEVQAEADSTPAQQP